MASSNNPNPNPNPTHTRPAPTFHESLPNTTFVQADPSTFRAVVQRLTGATCTKSPEIGPRRPPFKLHERRPTARKLEIKLNGQSHHSPSTTRNHHYRPAVMVSPVSPLEYLAAPTPMDEEERAIAEKGFYLHPSPLSTPRGSDPPELLPLFPLYSPTSDDFHHHHHHHNTINININND